MKKERAQRLAKILIGYDGTFNDDSRMWRLANAITTEHEHRGVFTPALLKRKLQSFVDRCNNYGIKTLGEFLIHPISKV